MNVCWKPGLVRGFISLLALTNAATLAWAICFSHPHNQASANHCNLAGTYNQYRPDPPMDCDIDFNMFNGCRTRDVARDIQQTMYTNPNCTGSVISQNPWTPNGTVQRATAYVCLS